MSAPQLEQYPGYFPDGSRPFWTRLKVGIVAGVVGLILGLAGGGSEAESSAAQEKPDDSAVRNELAQAVREKDDALKEQAELEEQLRSEEAQSAKAVRQVQKRAALAQRRAVQAAVAKVRGEERRRAAAAVQAAKAAASAPATPVAPLASSGGATDPQFSYCYEANDAGYGPYYSGQDPEYDWYDDRDGDGVVCET